MVHRVFAVCVIALISLWGCSQEESLSLRGSEIDTAPAVAMSAESARSLQISTKRSKFGRPGTHQQECPCGYVPITDWKECEALAKSRGKVFAKKGRWKYALKGCYGDTYRVFYNANPRGRGKVHHRPLCVETSSFSQSCPVTTTTTSTFGPMCDGNQVTLHLDFTDVINNNLGGKGPNDADPHKILYRSAGQLDGTTFDVSVEVLNPDYEPPVGMPGNVNGLTGSLPTVSVKTTEKAELKISFLTTDGQPVFLPEFKVDIFDIDYGIYSTEHLTVGGYSDILFPSNANFDFEDASGGKLIKARSFGEQCDNPTTSSDLPVVECDGNIVDPSKKMFRMTFENMPSFYMTLDAPFRDNLPKRDRKVKGGRVILFDVAVCVTPTTTTTSATGLANLCECMNTDNGAQNSNGHGCDMVDTYYDCYDDDDFTLHDMCCHQGNADTIFEPDVAYKRGGSWQWSESGLSCGPTTTTTTTVCTKPNGDGTFGPCDTCDHMQNMVHFNFEGKNVDSNLGGQGPDDDKPHLLRYYNVGRNHDNVMFDLTVKVENNDYVPARPHPTRFNGVDDKLARIGVVGGGKANLTFTFVESGTVDKEVQLSSFFFSAYDIDEGTQATEKYTVSGYDSIKFPDKCGSSGTNSDCEYTVSDDPAGGGKIIESKHIGYLCDNPKDPLNLVGVHDCPRGSNNFVHQKERAFTMVFQNKRGFNIGMEAPKTKGKKSAGNGRIMLFTGEASLCPPAPSTTTTTTTSTLNPACVYDVSYSYYGGGSGDAGFGDGDAGFGDGDAGFGDGDAGFGEGDAGFGDGEAGFGDGEAGYGEGNAGFGYGEGDAAYGEGDGGFR